MEHLLQREQNVHVLKPSKGNVWWSWTDLGALYVVVQVVPEGVDEVDGVVSGIDIGVAWEQDWRRKVSVNIPEI